MSQHQELQSRSLQELLAPLQEERKALASRYRIDFLGVFGSYVRGEAGPDSDLDVLVAYETPPSLFEFVRLQDELSKLLGVSVDLVMRSALKPAIGERILDEVVEI